MGDTSQPADATNAMIGGQMLMLLQNAYNNLGALKIHPLDAFFSILTTSYA